MTINQAIDGLTSKKKLNKEQRDFVDSLKKLKFEFGGNTKIENVEQVENLIRYGKKEKEEEKEKEK
jgi:hypothetical protein